MTATAKNQTPLIVPPSSRRAGFKPGEPLEFRASGGIITITAKPPSVDEYTPEQRRAINRRLKQSMKDIEEGRSYGPYETVEAMIESIEGELKRRAAAKKRKRAG